MRALAVLAIVLAGCGSYSTYRTTRIAPRGETKLLFAAQVSGARAPEEGIAPLPELVVGARRGVGDRYEVQATGTLLPIKQATTGSLELAGKARLLEHGRWSIAAGAAAGYRLGHSGGAYVEGVFVSAPIIGAVDLGKHQLVYSIVGGTQRWYASGARPVDTPFVGQSIGFVWQVARNWAVLPEVGVAYTPADNFTSDDSRLFHVGIAAFQSR
jgi:hypothetical protein